MFEEKSGQCTKQYLSQSFAVTHSLFVVDLFTVVVHTLL